MPNKVDEVSAIDDFVRFTSPLEGSMGDCSSEVVSGVEAPGGVAEGVSRSKGRRGTGRKIGTSDCEDIVNGT